MQKFSTFSQLKKEKPDYIITFTYKDFKTFLKFNYNLFGAFLKENDIKKDIPSNVVGVLIDSLPVYKIIMKLKNKLNTVQKIGIVLHNEIIIKKIASLMIYNPLIKIYEVKNKAEILYKFKKAIEENDFILLLPDDFVLNYFTFQKILKMIKEEDIKFGGYSKSFLKYGADFAFEIDYEKEGEIIGNFLKNISKTKKNQFQKFYINFIKVYFKNE